MLPMTGALNAPAFTQEKTYLTVIGNALRLLDEMKARQAWARSQPFNPAMQSYAIKPSSLINMEVMKTLGANGSVIDEES